MTGFSDAIAWVKSNFDVTGSAAEPPPVFPPPAPPVAPSLGVTPDATMRAYEDLLALREGRRTTVYLDSRGKPTVGIGHLVVPGDCLNVGDRVSDATVDLLFRQDSRLSMSIAITLASEAGITDKAFLPYLASVCYQLGNGWTRKFPNTWAMICNGEYEAAAQALDNTAWADQTPVRVEDFAGALRRLPPKA